MSNLTTATTLDLSIVIPAYNEELRITPTPRWSSDDNRQTSTAVPASPPRAAPASGRARVRSRLSVSTPGS